MTDSLSQIYLHIVFSTKNRYPYFQDAELRKATHSYLAQAARSLGCPAFAVGGVEDHVHIGCRLAKQMTVADLVRRLKKESSIWLKQEGRGVEGFYWQVGYGAFSVSPAHLDPLRAYIQNQEAHHKREDYGEELRRLLVKYGLDREDKVIERDET